MSATNGRAAAGSERSPLLAPPNQSGYNPTYNRPLPREPEASGYVVDAEQEQARRKRRGVIGSVVTALFILGLILAFVFFSERITGNPSGAAHWLLDRAPVIDGHIDLPILVRSYYGNNISAFDLKKDMPGHVDIPRLRKGKVGGFFWSVYVSCAEDGPFFLKPTNRVRDTLEQIDVAKLMIEAYPDTFELALSSENVEHAIQHGRIASLLGVEGAHQLGNSLAVLRQYQQLGVRYVTLTHGCHNVFADSGGILEAPEPFHGGLSKLGRALVREMNRLGVLVDLSHVSDATASQALNLSLAPVIWSHSSARAVRNVSRNVPDEILRRLSVNEEPGKKDGVVMVNFAPFFVAPEGKATVEVVADHIDHIGNVAGRAHVGIGSDFDGIGDVPVGLEDVSKYPDLFSVLVERGWHRTELAGLAGANLLRVMRGAERVSSQIRLYGIDGKPALPAMDIYHRRRDLPRKPKEVTLGHEDEEAWDEL